MKTILTILIMLLSLFANATVIELKTADQVKTELAKPGPRVLMYYTDWCPSCHEFMPIYKKLSNNMTNVKFYTMNVDKLALKEHAGKVPYIPTMFVGKSDSDLRDSPCTDLNRVERTIPILKKTIEGCLNK